MTVSSLDYKTLEERSLRVREHVIGLSTNGGCFIGASLSAVDLIVYLYSEFLNINQSNLADPNRDYLFLSKGHDVPALYGTFVELGLLEKTRLQNHLSTEDHIYWHPNTNIPGVEFHSGSLGHLPSVAIGVAMDLKICGSSNKVVCILGDGELNEGTCWEAILVASAHKLDNLIFVVDRNFFQANARTEELIPLEPLADKFLAFGAAVKRVDGHSFTELHQAFSAYPFESGKPNVVIADTVRGKGLPSIQERADRWFCNFSADEVEQLLLELHGQHQTTLTSETLIVR
ncbi:thiamine pyrophosphate-dependent enzyme [Mucilaginibacter sp. RS28]|uniref:Thiamine pyrophosphate-dependent enzyme n=1 Tax=Mucilaginibacter straminoryzae TaxID=2932774 RepID=A0A9X1X6X0_9SPHI|nr:1-deoxy-D-xylulose-5-phosphate synthase N-terminal domain-containing protein [Mucilaginibacter straminoryzae]MCJ8211490.1 thiamine pyrophosphate-dependent enzyme [Mucilaginibacter straminoryzae]